MGPKGHLIFDCQVAICFFSENSTSSDQSSFSSFKLQFCRPYPIFRHSVIQLVTSLFLMAESLCLAGLNPYLLDGLNPPLRLSSAGRSLANTRRLFPTQRRLSLKVTRINTLRKYHPIDVIIQLPSFSMAELPMFSWTFFPW